MKHHTIVGLALAMAVFAAQAQAAGDPAAGKAKSESCGSCHGVDGNASVPLFPKLAGQHQSYLSKQLHEFKSQKRVDQTVMNAMAESLTDADIADISSWFSQQKIKPEPPQKNVAGEAIYRSGISAKAVPACMARSISSAVA